MWVVTCHEGALALSQLALHISQPLQSIGQLVPLLLQHRIIHPLLLSLLLLQAGHHANLMPGSLVSSAANSTQLEMLLHGAHDML